MHLSFRMEKLESAAGGSMAKRVLMECRYALEISKIDIGKWDSAIDGALTALEQGLSADGTLTDSAALAAEQKLLVLQDAAKRYTVLCVGHAHIDMNWMWRYDETVSITLDTFRTVLKLMDEYPDFRFSQSQASVYEIVERYDPEMLDAIRARIKEGRWEVSAATWVEADRNMPSGESVARHLLYTRRYLSDLLEIDGESLTLDYEPDTFGHGAATPEMLSQGGIKYYYHCRGDEGELLYRWRAPSGAEVLCYREPYWYLGPIQPEFALGAPSFCERYGVPVHMRVYGVGDHGGGPTRADIEALLDMAQWPVFPVMRFGTYREFYESAAAAQELPVVEGELNLVFTGCYTSQARITQSNRFGEAKLEQSERFAAQSALAAGTRYPHASFEKAWRNVLFNQFHDILPGSGVIDTREHALGIFSETLAISDTQKSKALRSLGALADTSAYISDEGFSDSRSEGAGVGFGVGHSMTGLSPTLPGQGVGQPFRIAQTGRGRGINRVFHIFNPSAFPRREVAELTLFDWPGDYNRIKIIGPDGADIPFQLLDKTPKEFWQHRFVRVLVDVKLPAGGRTSCVLTQDREAETLGPPGLGPRIEPPFSFVLENEHLRAEFSPDDGTLVSLTDLSDGTELIDAPAAFFRLIHEQPAENTAGTAWTVGRYRSVLPMTGDVTIRRELAGPLKNAITIVAKAADSTVRYTVSLAAGAKFLDIDCDIDWREVGVRGECTPQLNFTLPCARRIGNFVQNIPGGVLERGPVAQDVPCQSFAAARYSENCALFLVSDSKYGFRCDDNTISLDCLRSSTDPDPYPEFGRHRFRIGIGVSDARPLSLLNSAHTFCHPADTVSDLPRAGSGKMSEEWLSVEGAFLQAVKLAENSRDLIVRLINPSGSDSDAAVRLWSDIRTAAVVDSHENPLPNGAPVAIAGDMLRFSVRAHGTVSLRITL